VNAPRVASLDDVEAAVWRELERAAATRGHAWRQSVLATVDGERADARTVVLREASAAERTLTVFTDERSPKVRQILRHPHGTLVAWCATLGWQLRLSLRLELETTGLAVSSRWARLKMTPAAHDYLSPLPPGTPLAQPAPARGTREYFAVITAHVEAVDWLELHAEGHRRALFDAQGARWVAP
jgi:pyridoxamine 5'-phosphate oxidase